MKKNVLILGAGMVVQPLVDYLIKNNITLTIASRTQSKAEHALKLATSRTGNHENGRAISWTIDDLSTLEKLIEQHDLVVSLLPYTHHVTVARLCISHHTNMVTTSYISEEMKSLHQEAQKAGVLILNEIGVDPGFDHMTAKKIIDQVHAEGGRVNEFFSLCGALAAPEAADNPLRYKFSWSPKGVVMAGNNDARYLRHGQTVYKPTEDLFKDPLQIDFPGVGPMEVYPNRNSLPYLDLYNIPEAETIYRGTFRYQNWCAALDILKSIGWTSYDEHDTKGMSCADLTARLAALPASDQLAENIIKKYHISMDHPAMAAMTFLGLLSDQKINSQKTAPIDLLSELMMEKMMLGNQERDMVIMQHIFRVTYTDGRHEKITSSLTDYGDDTYTSIAKTVALPAAIAVKMILENKITLTGVHLPVVADIYLPVLEELASIGIAMEEKHEPAD